MREEGVGLEVEDPAWPRGGLQTGPVPLLFPGSGLCPAPLLWPDLALLPPSSWS